MFRSLCATLLLSGCSTVPAVTSADRLAAIEAELDELRARVAACEVGEADRTVRRHRERRRTTVRTDELDDWLADPSSLGRALLHRGPGGDLDGYRVSSIRPGTPLDRLGLHNGDIVHAVSGRELTSFEDALSAYRELRDVEQVSLELTRRGEPLELVVDVVGLDGTR